MPTVIRSGPYAENVMITEDTLNVDLSDGRTISVPLNWFPRLEHATQKQRDNWRLIVSVNYSTPSVGRHFSDRKIAAIGLSG